MSANALLLACIFNIVTMLIQIAGAVYIYERTFD